MLVLSWNCRGLARPAAFRSLRALVRLNNPDCIFLMETKSSVEIMTEITSSLGFTHAVFVPPIVSAGGLCFCWKPGVDIEPTSQNQNLINLLVFSDPPNLPWMLSAIYGPPYKKMKRIFWESLHQTASSFSGPWLCMGDFNEILLQVDKKGGRPFSTSSSNGFNSLVNQQGLIDLGFSGNPYTWTNKRQNFANIKERLDRAFSNSEWRSTFPKASVYHFPATTSDHNPIILNTNGIDSSSPKPFRFEAMWTRDGSSTQVIKDAWNCLVFGSPLYKFVKKLKVSKNDLIWWNKHCFGQLQTRNKVLSEAINSIQQLAPTEANLQKEKTLTWEFNENLRREDLLWKQKSRVQWLTSPNLNTKFFHVSTIIRRRKNAIDFLKNDNNEWLSDRNEIGDCFVQFFQNLFSSSNPQFPDDLDNLISPVISDEDNILLSAIPSADEIKQTLFSLGSDKSPGPDGMSALFYKHYWEIISHDLIEAITSFFTRGHILTEINRTFITLIPKSDKAAKVNQFRPISLCNTIYKIISKILAARLKPLLHKVISPWQSAFVPGRVIQDNSIIAHEVLNTMKRKSGFVGLMALKIDIEKAFDIMEWPFILNVLRLHGFSSTWINWVSQCISTPTFSFLINGSPFGNIKSSRGLRQGDPLSPFLYIIGADVLSRLLQRAESLGSLKGIKISPGCPQISHLQFADDLLIFSKAIPTSARSILDCLASYQAWSGQKINYSKSGVIFSKNTTGQTSANLCHLLNLKKSSPTTKHLGLPLELNRAKSSSFQDLIEKIQNRVAGWKTKLLSQAARTTLISNVAASIPSYTMSSLLLPKTICKKIDSSLRGFWWGASPGKNHMCLKSWKSICQPKSYGGLGLRRTLDTNYALISKLGWSLAVDEDKAWVSLLKSKYLKGVPFMQIIPSQNCSWLWKGILKSRSLLRKGLCTKIGNGQHTAIWESPWIPSLDNFIPPAPTNIHPSIHRVADLIIPDTFQWDRGKISTLFDPITASKILNIHLSPTSQLDKLCWVPNSNGIHSVRSAYLTDQNERFTTSGPLPKSDWNSLWKAKISPRHKILLWKLAWDILPTKATLAARIPAIDTTCHLCNAQVETALHIFTQCPITQSIWLTSPWPIHPNRLPFTSISDWVAFILNPGQHLNLQLQEAQSFTLLASVICDQVWFHRNKMLKSIHPSPASTTSQTITPTSPPPHLAHEILKTFLFHQQAWEFSSQHTTIPTHKPWSPPPPGWHKINFDAAVRPNQVYLAAICRNHMGRITHAWLSADSHGDSLWAEAKAALFAVSSALASGLDSIIFEGDSLQVISSLQNSATSPHWSISNIINDINVLALSFSCISFSHVLRAANTLAHSFAAWAPFCSSLGAIPISSIPAHVVQADMVDGIGPLPPSFS
jgi:hypothetical protein